MFANLKKNLSQKLINILQISFAEFLGTLILVTTGTAMAVIVTLSQSKENSLDSSAIAITFGLTLMILASTLGKISGGHFNPAVTLGLFLAKQFPIKLIPFYWIAQVFGAVCGSYIVYGMFGKKGFDASLGAATPSPGVTYLQMFLIETFITFLLVYTVISVCTDERADPTMAPLVIGITLTVAVYIGMLYTGGSVNPARYLGPAIVTKKYIGIWVYMISPLIAAILAAAIYSFVSKGKKPEVKK